MANSSQAGNWRNRTSAEKDKFAGVQPGGYSKMLQYFKVDAAEPQSFCFNTT